tara:strand:+ start:1524 stop:1742 length:219 start_codon:yes stop_codon:yes gene_type:complete
MKIKVEKKLLNDNIIRTEELHFTLPQKILEELNWDDGTVVEFESFSIEKPAGIGEDLQCKVLLRNIDDKILD